MKKALLMEKFFAFIVAIFCLYILSSCTVTSENKKEPELSSISIKNYPDRMTFNQGEKLSFTGLVIQANYADGSKKDIPNSEVQIYPPEGTVLQKIGNQTIKVSYNGKSIYFDVKVIDNSSESVTLSSIIVDHESSKKTYEQGEKFNTYGISVLGVYSDGSQKTVTGWTTVPANGAVLSNTGNTTVTVTYQNCSATFTISVQEKPKIVSSSYFWGSWVRMDNGEMYEILETSVKKASREYTISSVTSDSITVSTLGTFKKESDSVMLNNNIPYFRNGGTNLDYSLKIVGFTEPGLSGQGDSSRAVSPSSFFNLSGLKGTSKSVKYKSFESNGESDENGILHLKAPTMNDVQSVTIDATDFGYGLVAIPDIMISNTGDYFGTVAIVDDDQYNLKITGTISDEQKDNGYLYGNNAKTYELALTITNISKNDCPSSYCKIEADDSRIQISSDEDVNRYVISTMKEGASKTIMLDVSFGQMTEPYVDTGIKVTLRNPSTKQEWTDYVPLRFFNGLIPITVSAKSHEKNSNAALNGFVIYPDGNNQFFSVVEGTSETVYVPTFGDKKEYMMVFSGATVSQQLSESTELFYSVAPGSSSEKKIDLKGMSDDELDECMGRNNHSEETAVFAEKELLGYLSQGKIDYYKIKANSDEITVISGKKVCKIQYVSDFGTVPEPVKVNEGDILTASELPELSGVEGYDFDGWYVGDRKVEVGDEVIGNIVLVGKWVTVEYKIEYELNGGKNAENNPTFYTIKSDTINLLAASRNGYEFVGWFENEKLEGNAINSILAQDCSNKKFWAKWEIIKYNIEYELNGGIFTSEPIYTYTIEDTPFNLPNLKREDELSIFEGWFETCGFEGDCTEIIEKASYGNKKFYAKWNLLSTNGYIEPADIPNIDFSKIQNECTIKIAGTLDESQLIELLEKMKSIDVDVVLDLSKTGLTNIPCKDEVRSYFGDLKLHSIILPETLSSIGDFVFYGCKIKSIIVPKSIKTIGKCAFSHCYDLETISLTDTEFLDKFSFSDCYSLKEISMKNIGRIGYNSFSRCRSLTNLFVDAQKIESGAFSECANLSEVTIGERVRVLDYLQILDDGTRYDIPISCFDNCKSLNSIVFEDPKDWTCYYQKTTYSYKVDFSNPSENYNKLINIRYMSDGYNSYRVSHFSH